jgi:hypothetical protein
MDGIGSRPMAETRKLAEPEVRIRRSPRSDEREFDHDTIRRRYDDYYTVDLTPYVVALRQRWKTVVLAAVTAAIATVLVTGLLLPKWYRATAVIRPIATPAVENRIAGVLGGLGGGLGLNGLAASLGAGDNDDAEEYIAILLGFQFNINLVERHDLSADFQRHSVLDFLEPSGARDVNWTIYRTLQKRFACEYSVKTGNITLYFEAKDRSDAKRILGYYIGDLRDLLRSRELSSASAAINSLEDEANSTPDSLLRAQLYDLVAKQVERKKMAQVEADFAFRVLDPPAVSDRPYRPLVLVDSALAAILTFLLLSAWITFSVRFRNALASIAERRV